MCVWDFDSPADRVPSLLVRPSARNLTRLVQVPQRLSLKTFFSFPFPENGKDGVPELLLQALYARPLCSAAGQHHRGEAKQR